MPSRFLCILFLSLVLARGATANVQKQHDQLTGSAAQAIPIHQALKFFPTATDDIVHQLYKANNFAPLWLDSPRSRVRAGIIANVLADSWLQGLYPDDYLLPAIHRLWHSTLPSDEAMLDLLLSRGLARYIVDIQGGRINPCLLDPQLFAAARSKQVPLLQLLQRAHTSTGLASFLNSLLPSHIDYRLLRGALARYRELAGSREWPSIPQGQTIKPGMRDVRLPLIVKRLQAEGDLPDTIIAGAIMEYTPAIVDGVKSFQHRFNLEEDGIVGSKTLATMNIPVSRLIQNILINMERWRWLPHTMTGRHLMVNIASFELSLRENYDELLRMPVIVGKVYHETPVFSDEMRYIVFNPYWNIPLSIAANEIVPSQIENPRYLAENNIKVFEGWDSSAPAIAPESIDWSTLGSGIRRYRLRQEPGVNNALGRLKFIFPNRYNIYLHDTPAQNLFSRNHRAFSHGCIRVSEPEKLARYLLQTNARPWNEDEIAQQISSGKRKAVVLDEPIPVHLLYRTTYVDPKTEKVYFSQDIYGRDALLLTSFFTENNKNICHYPPQ